MSLTTQAKRRPASSARNQKRYGQHHKHTKPFLKTYYPYLPLFVIAAVVVIVLGAKILGAPGAVIGSITVAIGATAIAI